MLSDKFLRFAYSKKFSRFGYICSGVTLSFPPLKKIVELLFRVFKKSRVQFDGVCKKFIAPKV